MNRAFVRPALFSSCLLIAVACLVQAACGDDSSAVKEAAPDSGPIKPGGDSGGPVDGGPPGDGAPSDCFTNPKTHFEIINACTTALKITKNPVLAKLLPEGGLPPLN